MKQKRTYVDPQNIVKKGKISAGDVFRIKDDVYQTLGAKTKMPGNLVRTGGFELMPGVHVTFLLEDTSGYRWANNFSNLDEIREFPKTLKNFNEEYNRNRRLIFITRKELGGREFAGVYKAKSFDAEHNSIVWERVAKEAYLSIYHFWSI